MTMVSAHTHERTCISCGAKTSKSSLYRIVRTKDNGVSFDVTGRAAGRGAYVCSPTCLEQAQPARLERALKTKVSAEDARAVAEALRRHVDEASGQ